MNIYTSNFSYAKKLREAGVVPISISRFSPRYYKGAQCKALAPRPDMLQMEEEEYKREFEKILQALNPEAVVELLCIGAEQWKGGEVTDVALLCFERYTDFCHRHLVAEWFHRELGIEIREFPARQEAELRRVNGILLPPTITEFVF